MNERIKKVRQSLGLTQQKFAARIGVKRNTVATYEMGRSMPSDAALSLICREFGVNKQWLYSGKGEMFNEKNVFSIDEFAQERGMTELECNIIKLYFSFSPAIRAKMMEDLKRIFLETQQNYTTPETVVSAITTPAITNDATATLTAKVETLERQNKELAARIEEMEKEDATNAALLDLFRLSSKSYTNGRQKLPE